MARLAAEACQGQESAEIASRCAALRDGVLALCEERAIAPSDARALCHAIDAAEAEALESFAGARRALYALGRACETTSAAELPRLILEGAPHADAAALIAPDRVIASAGAPPPSEGVAAAATEPLEVSGVEGATTVFAMPFDGGTLRVASRSAYRFPEDEKVFFRTIATRAGALLHRCAATSSFAPLIEASPLPIVAVRGDGAVQIWNRAAEELFGWGRGCILGKPAPIALSASAREVRAQRKDGSTLDLSISSAPLPDGGAIAILADISDRKRREAEAEQTARFREHLIGVVGHDLRNPLTAILASAQLLLRFAGLNEKQARVVGRISASADRMARMIDDLLDFARSRLGGGFPIDRRRMDLRELCEHTVEELEFAYASRTVRLEAEGDLWGSWDPDRMAQVISNLVANALQHSSEDGEVRVFLKGEHDVVVLRTHNRGPPIPPEVLPHVFEPGRRGDARPGGLGLGLYIVQQIVLAHGGNIEANSSADDGTTFTVVLPRKGRKTV
jgi:signal transduction histidine kinase